MANTKISELTPLSSPDVSDVLPIVNSGITKKITTANLKTFMSTSPTLVTPNLGVPSAGDISACTGSPTLTNLHTSTLHVTSVLQGKISEDVGADPEGTVTFLDNAIGVAVADETYKYAPLISSTTPTGSGAMVLATSPTFVTPNLGTIASGNISNATGSPAISLRYATQYGATIETAAEVGSAGTMCFDSDYLYICIATNTWKRIALADFPV